MFCIHISVIFCTDWLLRALWRILHFRAFGPLVQGGPLPVISRVWTPLIGVMTPVMYIKNFKAIYRGVYFGGLGSPYERDCYVGAPLESQTTNPSHLSTISWCGWPLFQKNWNTSRDPKRPVGIVKTIATRDILAVLAGFQNWNRWIEWKCLIFVRSEDVLFFNRIRTLGDTCKQIRGAVSQRSTVLGTLSSGRQRLMGYTSRTLIGIHGWFDDDGLNRTKVRYMSFLCLLFDPQHSHALKTWNIYTNPDAYDRSPEISTNKKPWWWEILVNFFGGNLRLEFRSAGVKTMITQPDCKKVCEV